MSRKEYGNHGNLHAGTRMSPEEYQKYSEIRAKQAVERLMKIMRRMKKELNKTEELLEDNILEDKVSSASEDENGNKKLETSVQSEETSENISGKFAKYEKILTESVQKGDQLCKKYDNKQKRKLLKRLKKVRSLNKKMNKKYQKYRMYIEERDVEERDVEERDVYEKKEKQRNCMDFIQNLGNVFLKTFPSLLCTVVKTFVSKISLKKKVFV